MRNAWRAWRWRLLKPVERSPWQLLSGTVFMYFSAIAGSRSATGDPPEAPATVTNAATFSAIPFFLRERDLNVGSTFAVADEDVLTRIVGAVFAQVLADHFCVGFAGVIRNLKQVDVDAFRFQGRLTFLEGWRIGDAGAENPGNDEDAVFF